MGKEHLGEGEGGCGCRRGGDMIHMKLLGGSCDRGWVCHMTHGGGVCQVICCIVGGRVAMDEAV